MEDEGAKLQEDLPSAPEENSRRTRVGFPQTSGKKQGKGKVIFIILAILALLAVGAWLLLGNRGEEEMADGPTSTPTIARSSPTPTQVELDREGVKIQILNGTGISGAAGDLRDELSELGYSDFAVGNASGQSYKNAEVTYGTDVDDEVKEELTSKLEDLYQDVDVKSGSAGDFDIRIITGYPKGHTPTPTEKPTSTSTPSPKPTSGVSLTTTPTTTTTPTPTP